LDGGGRGLVFQLIDALGCVPADAVGGQVQGLDAATRRALGRLGIRFGTESIYVAPFLQIEAIRFRALLWAVRRAPPAPETPMGRRGKAIAIDPDLPESYYAAIGRRVIGGLALRPDRLEQFAAALRNNARSGEVADENRLAAIAGIAASDLH